MMTIGKTVIYYKDTAIKQLCVATDVALYNEDIQLYFLYSEQ